MKQPRAPLHSNQWPYLLPGVERSIVVAYALWMLWGALGVHRAYLGKFRSAALYFLTLGLLGMGWLYDGLTLPRQVARCNVRIRAAQGLAPGMAAGRPGGRRRDPMQALLAAAARHHGLLTVTEGVLDTGLPFRKVEATLRDMMAAGYVDVRNHPESGVVQYVFPELMEPPPQHAPGEARPA